MFSRKKKSKKASLRSLGSFFLALAVLLGIRWALFEPYVIPSGSMIPSLLINDHILVNKFAFGVRWPFSKTWLVRFDIPQRGDVVVFRSVERDDFFMVKRVIGLPGDRIEYDADGVLVINGEPALQVLLTAEQINSNFYPVSEADIGSSFYNVDFYRESLGSNNYRSILRHDGARWPEEPLVVPEGHLFMMGDNRDNSRDSRVWGVLPIDNLLGKAEFVWLSCEETLPAAPFLCHPLHIRWQRFFHSIH